jgi:hypothetical protein
MANQYTSEHNIETLPKWAQYAFNQLSELNVGLNIRMQTLQDINAIMCEPKRDWFTLPFSHDDNKPIHLWLLDKDQPISVCSLGKGDIIFVGRAKKDEE